jgi:hypothetical protein
MYYYTYLLTNVTNGMKYIGKRQSTVHPTLDTAYKGSSKYVPKEECTKEILAIFDTSEEATLDEIRLHNEFNVAINPMFYNRAKQTSTKFDTTGMKFSLTEEQCKKISQATTGVSKTLSDAQRVALKERLASYRTEENRKKAAKALKENGSNKGIKNSQFSPWFISTETTTYLFTDISKREKALADGKALKHYIDLQRKLTPNGTQHSIYGKIISMGNLPAQYRPGRL